MFIDYATKEINSKIIYYGPNLAGKATSMKYMYDYMVGDKANEIQRFLIEEEKETNELLYFSWLRLEVGTIHGFSNRFHFYSMSKNNVGKISSQLLLENLDGVIFVADSQIDRMDANINSFNQLIENLHLLGNSIYNIPLVIQCNKRDLQNIYSFEEMKRLLGFINCPTYESIAITGVGVDAALKSVTLEIIMSRKKVLKSIKLLKLT